MRGCFKKTKIEDELTRHSEKSYFSTSITRAK